MTIHNHSERQKIEIARYRKLEQEVTDPLATCLLRLIADDLEADLRNARDGIINQPSPSITVDSLPLENHDNARGVYLIPSN